MDLIKSTFLSILSPGEKEKKESRQKNKKETRSSKDLRGEKQTNREKKRAFHISCHSSRIPQK